MPRLKTPPGRSRKRSSSRACRCRRETRVATATSSSAIPCRSLCSLSSCPKRMRSLARRARLDWPDPGPGHLGNWSAALPRCATVRILICESIKTKAKGINNNTLGTTNVDGSRLRDTRAVKSHSDRKKRIGLPALASQCCVHGNAILVHAVVSAAHTHEAPRHRRANASRQ